jgi:hypothetical protein
MHPTPLRPSLTPTTRSVRQGRPLPEAITRQRADIGRRPAPGTSACGTRTSDGRLEVVCQHNVVKMAFAATTVWTRVQSSSCMHYVHLDAAVAAALARCTYYCVTLRAVPYPLLTMFGQSTAPAPAAATRGKDATSLTSSMNIDYESDKRTRRQMSPQSPGTATIITRV